MRRRRWVLRASGCGRRAWIGMPRVKWVEVPMNPTALSSALIAAYKSSHSWMPFLLIAGASAAKNALKSPLSALSTT